MPKVRSTNDPQPARLTPEILEAIKAILRSSPSGDQDPELELHFDRLKTAVKSNGVTATTDQLVLALKELKRQGLIRGEHSIGVWGIEWISPAI